MKDRSTILDLYTKILKHGYTIGTVREVYIGSYTVMLRPPYECDEVDTNILMWLIPQDYKAPDFKTVKGYEYYE